MEQQHGILVLDKPKGLSSAQCVNRIKHLGQKKIGHAGTLDPMATGVLLVLLGQATKLSNYLLEGGAKTYVGTLRLGIVTDTWDIEGRILSEIPLHAEHFSTLEDAARADMAAWTAITEQPVPPYSAAKHQGQPLYKLARTGKEVPAKVKRIHISQAELQWVKLPDLRFRVTCSSGSYIRSLAHSLGIRLGCGATLTELTRQYSHPFGLEQAVSLDDLLDQPERLPQLVLPLHAALPQWPVITVTARNEADIRNGKTIVLAPEHSFPPEQKAILYGPAGNPLALVQADLNPDVPCWTILRGLFTP